MAHNLLFRKDWRMCNESLMYGSFYCASFIVRRLPLLLMEAPTVPRLLLQAEARDPVLSLIQNLRKKKKQRQKNKILSFSTM